MCLDFHFIRCSGKVALYEAHMLLRVRVHTRVAWWKIDNLNGAEILSGNCADKIFGSRGKPSKSVGRVSCVEKWWKCATSSSGTAKLGRTRSETSPTQSSRIMEFDILEFLVWNTRWKESSEVKRLRDKGFLITIRVAQFKCKRIYFHEAKCNKGFSFFLPWKCSNVQNLYSCLWEKDVCVWNWSEALWPCGRITIQVVTISS